MIRLPEGTPRYLMVHANEIARNAERGKTGTPIAIVIEPGDDGKLRVLRGYNVRVNGAVSLEYSQRTPLFKVRLSPSEEDMIVHAAYGTTSEIVLAETPDESLEETPEPAPKPESPKKK